jgi:hypothetical protein
MTSVYSHGVTDHCLPVPFINILSNYIVLTILIPIRLHIIFYIKSDICSVLAIKVLRILAGNV